MRREWLVQCVVWTLLAAAGGCAQPGGAAERLRSDLNVEDSRPVFMFVACPDIVAARRALDDLKHCVVLSGRVQCLLIMSASISYEKARPICAEIDALLKAEPRLRIDAIWIRSSSPEPKIIVIDESLDRRQDEGFEVCINGQRYWKADSGSEAREKSLARLIPYIKEYKPECIVFRTFRPDLEADPTLHEELSYWPWFSNDLNSTLRSCYNEGEGYIAVYLDGVNDTCADFIEGTGVK